MSDTPETDALHERRKEEFRNTLCQYFEMTDLARRLERERDEARRIAEHMKEAASTTAVYDVYKTKLPWEQNTERTPTR